MTIGVSGATGNVGARAVQLLLQAGARVRVLVRDAGRLPDGVRDAVEVVTGDLRDRAFVEGATDGLDGLLWVTPEDMTAADPLGEMAAVVANGAAAARGGRAGRVVVISSVGAERRHGAGLIDGLARAEQEFAASGSDVTILRNGYYFTNLFGNLDELRAGRLTTTMPADRAMPWVDPRDVGEVAAARLLATGWSGTVVQAVHGPEDLSWSGVAGVLTAAIGQKITVEVVPDAAMTAGLLQAGLSRAAADGLVGMIAGLRDGFEPEQGRTAMTTTPTTLAAWAAANLAPAVRG